MGYHYDPHFRDEEFEAQRIKYLAYLTELGFKPSSLAPDPKLFTVKLNNPPSLGRTLGTERNQCHLTWQRDFAIS